MCLPNLYAGPDLGEGSQIDPGRNNIPIIEVVI